MINFLPQCCICCLHQGFTDIQSDWKVGRSRWCPWSPDLIEHIIGPVKSFQINFRILTQNLFFICPLRLYINRMIDQIIRRNSFHEFLNWCSLDYGSANQRAAYNSLANRNARIKYQFENQPNWIEMRARLNSKCSKIKIISKSVKIDSIHRIVSSLESSARSKDLIPLGLSPKNNNCGRIKPIHPYDDRSYDSKRLQGLSKNWK